MHIPLTQGQFAVIDDQDAPLVSCFRWYATANKMKGYYAASTDCGSTIYMHRVITDAPKGKVVDHINHDTLDNRRCNLRVGTQKDNMANGAFALRTHCPKGHVYDEANTHINRNGDRICRACARDRMREKLANETPEQTTARLARCRAYAEANRDKRLIKQAEYTARTKDQKRLYDIARRPIKNARRRAQTAAARG